MHCEESSRRKGSLIHAGPFHAFGLPEPIRVTAYLPPDHDRARPAPLAIFFDGQNMFDDEGSYHGGWQLHRLLDWRACRGERVPVAVTLHTGGWSRAAMLSPWPREDVPGLGDRTLDWITHWLVPTIRSEVAIEPGPEHVAIGGASLGGLLALYGFFRNPDQFGRVIAMSPSIGAPGGHHGPLFSYVHERSRSDGRIYVDAGARECECTSILRHTGELAELLSLKGYRQGVDMLWNADPEGAHDEQSWKRRLPTAIGFACA